MCPVTDSCHTSSRSAACALCDATVRTSRKWLC
jgi:hypothetical protein